MYHFELPDIGEGVVEAEILAWRVQEGDRVEEDQVLVELLTDKAEIEVPSPRAGRVHRLHFQVGDVVPVGAVLLEIDDETPETAAPGAGGRTPAPAAGAPASSEAPAPARAADPAPLPERPRSRQRASEAPAPAAAVKAVPAVRELARRLGVDLGRLSGSGPGGRIMRRDVERLHAEGASRPAATPAPAAADEPDWRRQPLRGLRRTIARRMAHARRTAAHFTYVDEVDVTELLERAAAAGLEFSPLAFIAHASVRALARHPVLNASIDDERQEIVLKGKVHLGIATATEGGLLVPVIRDAAGLSLAELAAAIERLAQGGREGRLGPEQLRGSTFTISSLGKLGGIVSTPIVNPPEVAILGVNAIREAFRPREGRPVLRRVMNLSLSVDHRIADGLAAARFVADLRGLLEAADFPELGGEGRAP